MDHNLETNNVACVDILSFPVKDSAMKQGHGFVVFANQQNCSNSSLDLCLTL